MVLDQSRDGSIVESFVLSVHCEFQLMSKNIPTHAPQKHWNKWGVSSIHLKAYWKWIWSLKGPTKYILFRWLLLHATLGQSLKGDVATSLRQCCYCGDMQETTKHALWSCSLAQ